MISIKYKKSQLPVIRIKPGIWHSACNKHDRFSNIKWIPILRGLNSGNNTHFNRISQVYAPNCKLAIVEKYNARRAGCLT